MLIPKNFLLLLKRFSQKWIKPVGHDTGIKIFNCVTKTKEPLIVKNKNLVTWYTCGPTVYDSSHIGHASCFIKLDIIQRILRKYFNLNLVTVMNITDVDDKIIARSNAAKIPFLELTKQFEKEFWKDLEALGIRKPDCVLRVTQNIEIIKVFIQRLIEENKAYQSDNKTVYFDVAAHDFYGKLHSVGSEPPEPVKYKKSPQDFALWKPVKPGEIYWESSWGPGRPGWHIECSALASTVFGSSVDIHAGGVDLRFPHHENEEAQCCAFHNKPQWVNYWVHTGHLHLKDSEKMSKSLKNTVSVAALLENTSAQTFRMACIMSHYRKNMEFGAEFLKTASNTLQNYKNFQDVCTNHLNGLLGGDINDTALLGLVESSTKSIHDALVDDFNTPVVVETLNEVVSTVNGLLHSSRTDAGGSKSAGLIAVLNLVSTTLDLLGVSLQSQSVGDDSGFVDVMNILNDFRQHVRQYGILKKDQQLLALCDTVRDDLRKVNVSVKDFNKMSSWSRQ